MDTNKRIMWYSKIIIVALLFGIMLGYMMPVVSAFEFDNVLRYEQNDNVAIVENLFGIGGELARIEKLENTDRCFTECYTIWNVSVSTDAEVFLTNMFFVDIYGNDKEIPYEFYYAEEVIHETYNKKESDCSFDYVNGTLQHSCNEVIVGQGVRTTYKWKKFNPNKKIKGDYIIKMIGYKDWDESIDWQPDIFGVRVKKWDWWYGSNPTGYYKLDNSTANSPCHDYSGNNRTLTTSDATYGAGKLNNAMLSNSCHLNDFVAVGNQDFTVAFWLKKAADATGLDIITGSATDYINSNEWLIGYNNGVDVDAPLFIWQGGGSYVYENDNFAHTTGQWQRYVMTFEYDAGGDHNVTWYVDNTLTDNEVIAGTSNSISQDGMSINTAQGAYDCEDCDVDDVQIWYGSLWTATDVATDWNNGDGLEADGTPNTAPTVNLNAPADAYTTKETAIEFNCSSYDAEGPINLTLIIDDVAESTVTNSTANETLEVFYNKSGLSLGSYNWTCESWDAGDLQNFATNRSFTVSIITENSIDFNATTVESARESFTFNMSYNSVDYTGITGNLIYNGTSYSTTQSGTDDDRAFKTGLDIPVTDSGNQENRTFYWEIGLTNASGTSWFNSSTSTQTVDILTFNYCNSTEGQFINFTIFDYSDPNKPFVNATFESAWEFSVSGGNGSILKNYTYQNLSETVHEYVFCFSPVDNNYTVNTQIEYQKSGYAKNYYYLNDYLLTNASEAVSLYLLNDTDATATILQVVDRARNPVGDIYITIQSYDTGTDTYFTTGMVRTSSLGEDLAYLNWYDTFYKFLLVENGTTVKIEGPQKVTETPQIFEYFDTFISSFDKFEDFEYDLYYNDNTSNVVLTFIKPSGSVDSGCLRVTKRNVTNDYKICDQCETSSSATIYCNIANQGNGTFIGEFYATGSLKYIGYITAEVGSFLSPLYDTLGQTEGTVYAMLFAVAVVTLFLFSPTLAILGLLIGMFLGTVLGFQPMHQVEFIGIAIVGGIVIWLINR